MVGKMTKQQWIEGILICIAGRTLGMVGVCLAILLIGWYEKRKANDT